ncbi:TPA_asm: hypothetical protein GDL74_17840 [Salmonella enterica]|nr:hypothetical protein [Salmonella enterica]EEF3101634.1 hypothetical protein [Salmonella enterica]EEG8231780.1 hypothetical protein [Salmonella enterica]EEJ5315517.1 hypothetical protein [Salmonella enterica]EFT6735419.1 hypothetical protein [Salmonella enterica]
MNKAQQAVTDVFSTRATATMAQLREGISDFTATQVSSAVAEMRRTGRIVRVDKGGNTAVYELRADPKLPITEQCRQNWQGYQIHKIFGSAGRVTA